MRLLQVNLRGLLIYSLILLLISIPVSLVSIDAILRHDLDRSLALEAKQFLQHVKKFESLEDLERDLVVLDELSYNIQIHPAREFSTEQTYQTVTLYDSLEGKNKPFRELQTGVMIRNKPYALTLQMSFVEDDEVALTIFLVQIALSVILTIGLTLLNRSLSKRLWRPFYHTLDRLKAYELDKNESIPEEHSVIDEFNDLNKTVTHLTERNRRVFLEQKEFIENASHELQTPIAIFQSKLDALMQSPNLRQSEADTLAELEQTALRMARLNKSLLLLSKIENEQFIDTEQLDLAAIVRSHVDAVGSMASTADLKISVSLQELSIDANRILVDTLISNLLHNAIRYSLKDETIQVSLQDSLLTISNRGRAARLSLDDITRRFNKDSANPESTGLGLAIVKKICENCHYDLTYSFENAIHRFHINFQSRVS